jgi:imidazole glycerol-phosphate synthase subunit HisF
MLTKRIIPCLDVAGGRVVKGISFVKLRDAGDPVELGRAYSEAGADELVFLDITASSDQRNIVVDMVERVSKVVFIPFTVGGGLREVEDMRRILEAGADKITVNTAAIQNPQLIADGAARFGNQCIVLALDAKRLQCRKDTGGKLGLDAGSRWEVYTHGGREPAGIDALKWAKEAVRLGAGELLVTSMDYDGHLTGYDLELTRALSESLEVPVIASGGAGTLDHLYEAVALGKADAVLAASIFHYGTYTIRQAKEYLASKDIPVRM